MSDQKFLKATCHHCGGHIEFPAEGLGMTVPCPHCQAKMVLKVEAPPAPSAPAPVTPPPAPVPVATTTTAPVPSRPPTPPAPARPVPPPPSTARSTIPKAPVPQPSPEGAPVESPSGKSRLGMGLITFLALVVLGAAGYVGYNKFMADKDIDESVSPAASPSPASNVPSSPQAEAPPRQSSKPDAAKAPKSPKDLKTSELILEKSKGGSSLVYAVGTIRNESDHQRFGVKVEVDILDGRGKKVGKATDYIQVIEPREEWRFHALVLEDRAAAAKIASIKEDE